jgi:uncharacterized protein
VNVCSLVTVIGLQLASVLVGAIVIEQVFVLPGLGSLLLGAVASHDLIVIQGIVMLLVPRKNHQPGTGDIFIATGRGAEGFLTDAAVGRIRDAMLPALAQEQYGSALSLGVDLLAQAFATEFGVTLSSPEYVRPPPAQSPTRSFPISSIILLVVLLIIFSRGRILWLPFLLSGMRGSGWSSGRGGGWGGGRGGWGGGGGFGGFGGGGGFSGGGAGGRF